MPFWRQKPNPGDQLHYKLLLNNRFGGGGVKKGTTKVTGLTVMSRPKHDNTHLVVVVVVVVVVQIIYTTSMTSGGNFKY